MSVKSIPCPRCASRQTRANRSEQVCMKCGHRWQKDDIGGAKTK